MKQNLIENNLNTAKNKQGLIKKYSIEIFSFILYSSLLVFAMYYHEPWLDEAQAWLIARDATIFELFSSITHYEGHPPLWFLILMPFAKSGIPFEIGLKIVNFAIVNLSAAIFIFKAPFNRFFRCTIPFTYFFFYQYGVISRSYSLVMLGFLLSAMFYKNRNEKPLRLSISLMLLCGSSAYGIVISFGIVIIWIFENIKNGIFQTLYNIRINKKLFISWTILFVFNIMLLIMIYPIKDTFAVNIYKGSWIDNIIYMLLVVPMEAMVTNSIYTNKTSSLYYLYILIGGYLFNIVLLFFTLMYKKANLYLIPFILFSIFSSAVYFTSHHIGIIALFYVFIIWCCIDDYNNTRQLKIFNKNINNKLWCNFTKAVFGISIIISIYWSVSSVIFDIKNNYGNGREISEFISDNNMDKLNIYAAWYPISVRDDGTEIYDYNLLCGIPTMAYFNENIFCNFNQKNNDKSYLLHKVNNDNSYIENLIRDKKTEALLISNRIQYTFGDYIDIEDFALVKIIKANMIWKNSNNEFEDFIYIRRDLLKKYPQLKEINAP